jgi:glycosyltransferase involved in cell wall biosynthesis
MASGKAIVSTSLGALGINAENRKHLFIANSGRDIVNAVISLLKDRNLRMELGKNAQELARAYDWSGIAEKRIRAYRELKLNAGG